LGNYTINDYDPNSKLLISTTDAKKQTTKFSYNSRGKITKEILPNGLVKEYSYDNRDNLLSDKLILRPVGKGL